MISYSELPEDEAKELFKEIIKDHCQYPRQRGLKEGTEYYNVHLKNPSCGDDLTVQVAFDGERIKDIRQEGEGCSICCASASMMAETCMHDTIEVAGQKIRAFRRMVSGEPYEGELLGEAVSLQGVVKVPPRIKCATLSWLALERALEQEEKMQSFSTEDGEALQKEQS